jgi:hypothetical protein
MIRSHDSWELGEPELNDKGQLVIHDIASKLGCIRPSLNLPFAFLEGAEDFAELQLQLQATRSETRWEDAGGRNQIGGSSMSSPAIERTDRASSCESDHSNSSKDYNQKMWSQQLQAATKKLLPVNTTIPEPTPMGISQELLLDGEASYESPSFDTTASTPSIYTDFQTESPASPIFSKDSPFSP